MREWLAGKVSTGKILVGIGTICWPWDLRHLCVQCECTVRAPGAPYFYFVAAQLKSKKRSKILLCLVRAFTLAAIAFLHSFLTFMRCMAYCSSLFLQSTSLVHFILARIFNGCSNQYDTYCNLHRHGRCACVCALCCAHFTLRHLWLPPYTLTTDICFCLHTYVLNSSNAELAESVCMWIAKRVEQLTARQRQQWHRCHRYTIITTQLCMKVKRLNLLALVYEYTPYSIHIMCSSPA